MDCENIPKLKPQDCQGVSCNQKYNPKLYIIEDGDKLKVYEANGLQLGRFIGYGRWNKNGGIDVEQQIP